MKKKIALVLLFPLLAASLAFSLSTPPVVLEPPSTTVPVEFFGMHIHHLFRGAPQKTPWPSIRFGSWRLWDAYVTWPNLEPQKGQWNFSLLDKYVALAQEHNVEILMPLAFTPPWASARPKEKSYYSPGVAAEPKNIADWQNYVHTVATRYKGRIHEYEIWNEPNSKGFYTGSIPELVTLSRVAYETLKKVDPTIVVSSPPPSGYSSLGWFDQYLKAGGGRYADVIGYHFYVNPGPPEEMVPLIQQVEEVMRNDDVGNKPLWDTETGWAIQDTRGGVKPAPGHGFNSVVLSPDVAAAYVARAYILSWAAGVSRLYWYSWDNRKMGLVDRDGKTLKAPAIAYGQVENWLVGATMKSCGSNSEGTWMCEITRPGYHGWILWNPTATQHLIAFHIPISWHVTRVRDLLGHVTTVKAGATFEVSIMPHLLDSPVQ